MIGNRVSHLISIGRSDLLVRLLDKASEVRELQKEFWGREGRTRRPNTQARSMAAEKELDRILVMIEEACAGTAPKTLFDMMEDQGQ